MSECIKCEMNDNSINARENVDCSPLMHWKKFYTQKSLFFCPARNQKNIRPSFASHSIFHNILRLVIQHKLYNYSSTPLTTKQHNRQNSNNTLSRSNSKWVLHKVRKARPCRQHVCLTNPKLYLVAFYPIKTGHVSLMVAV